MRDILETMLALVLGVIGTSFLLGVLVGMVFASVGRAGGGRRGVALPVRDGYLPKAGPTNPTPVRGSRSGLTH